MDISKELQNIQTIAVKEFMDNISSKRFLIIGIVYFGMALLLALLAIYLYTSYSGLVSTENASSWTGMQAKAVIDSFKPDIVLSYMNSLNIILALLAVLVSADTISAEFKDRTVYQLLSKPVSRSSVIIGKFLGCLGVVTILFLGSAVVAYVITAVVTWHFPAVGDLPAITGAIISMVLLLAVYVALGVLISTLTRNPFVSIIGAFIAWIGLWFSNTIGHFAGDLSQASQAFIMGDAFDTYPIFAKVLIWIYPLSHGIMTQLLDPTSSQVAAGLPLWGNVVFVLVYSVVLLIAAILVFEYLDVA